MDSGEGSLERRKQERFKVKESFFAALIPGNKIGQIKEISKGGLTFQCVDKGSPASSPVQIDLFSSVYDFNLRNVPVKSIADFEIDNTVPLSSLQIRQLNIKFGKMTPTQAMLLDFFLEKYTYR